MCPWYKPDGTPMTPEEKDAHKLELAKVHPYHGKPPGDPFSVRFGYIAGRCNAYRHSTGHAPKTQGLCKSYPVPGHMRCRRHGGRGNNGGWRNGNRPIKPNAVENDSQ